MNIKPLLETELWNAIEKNYASEDYTGAITNAVYYLRDIIREKSNLELDSRNLITTAFSQKDPKIKVNKLQTDTEKNEQDGLRDSLLGVFGLIRNTRTHKKHEDTQEDALSIILHINYLLKIIGKAQSSFSIDSFIKSVYDEYFEQTEEYAKLLVSEIPRKQLEDTIFNLYGRMGENIYEYNGYDYYPGIEEQNYKKLESLKLIFVELLNEVRDDNKEEIFEKIMDDFKTLNTSNEFFWKVNLILDKWDVLGKRIRLRLVNMVTQYMPDVEHETYQRKIFLEGWKYFDEDTKSKIEKLHINDTSDYYIEDEKLKYIVNRVPRKKNSLQQKPEIDTNEDEIPF